MSFCLPVGGVVVAFSSGFSPASLDTSQNLPEVLRELFHLYMLIYIQIIIDLEALSLVKILS